MRYLNKLFLILIFLFTFTSTAWSTIDPDGAGGYCTEAQWGFGTIWDLSGTPVCVLNDEEPCPGGYFKWLDNDGPYPLEGNGAPCQVLYACCYPGVPFGDIVE